MNEISVRQCVRPTCMPIYWLTTFKGGSRRTKEGYAWEGSEPDHQLSQKNTNPHIWSTLISSICRLTWTLSLGMRDTEHLYKYKKQRQVQRSPHMGIKGTQVQGATHNRVWHAFSNIHCSWVNRSQQAPTSISNCVFLFFFKWMYYFFTKDCCTKVMKLVFYKLYKYWSNEKY